MRTSDGTGESVCHDAFPLTTKTTVFEAPGLRTDGTEEVRIAGRLKEKSANFPRSTG